MHVTRNQRDHGPARGRTAAAREPFRYVWPMAAAATLLMVSAAPRIAETVKTDVEITEKARNAIKRGLAYLAAAQSPEGHYGHDRYGKHVGITALACLAFMADGHLPDRGTYGTHVQRGLAFIVDQASESGLIAADTSHGPMYGHGFATLFLGEIYGMTADERVRDVLIKAVRLIVATQNKQGGWRYHPIPLDADISVTICQIMALRSARNAGISVPKGTIDRSIEYVKQCQNRDDGGFRYMIGSGTSLFPRSAAGVASLYYAGVYEDDALQQGLQYLLKHKDLNAVPRSGHYFYGQYYAVQAMFLAGEPYWTQWFSWIRVQLLNKQQQEGEWPSAHGSHYGTAMALLILELPQRLLPIFQR